MSISTSIPTAAGRRRFHPLLAISAIAAVITLSAWAVATYAVDSPARSVRSGTPSQASALRQLSPAEPRYVVGIAALTPLQLWAAFGTSPTPPEAHDSAGKTTASSATQSLSVALPILPACGRGPCWEGAPGASSPRGR